MIQIAKSPCYPPYGVVVGPDELWDCDCASGSEEQTLALAAEQYPNEEVVMWSDPRHYSVRKSGPWRP